MQIELQGQVRFAKEGQTLTGSVTRTGPDGTLDLESIRIEIADASAPGKPEAEVLAARGRVRIAGGGPGAALVSGEPVHLEEASGTYFDPASPGEPVRFRAAAADLDPEGRVLRASGASHLERGPFALDGEDLHADLAKRAFTVARKVRFSQVTPDGRRLAAFADGPARADLEDPRADGWRRATFVLENAVRLESESPRGRLSGTGDRLTATAEVPPRGAGRAGGEPGRIRELSLEGNAALAGGFGRASSKRVQAWLDDAGGLRRLLAPEGALLLLEEASPAAAASGEGFRLRAVESRGALEAERSADAPDRFDVSFAGPTLLHDAASVLPTHLAGTSFARLERGALQRLTAFGGVWLRFGGAVTYAPAAEIVPEGSGFRLALGPAALVDARGLRGPGGSGAGAAFSSGGWTDLRVPAVGTGAPSASLPDGASVEFEGGGSLEAGEVEFRGGSAAADRRLRARGGYRLADPARGVSGSGGELAMEGEEAFATTGSPARLEFRAADSTLALAAERISGERGSLRAEGSVEIALPASWLGRAPAGSGGDAPVAERATIRCARFTATRDPDGTIRTATLEEGVEIGSSTLSAACARAELDRASGRHRLLGGTDAARLTFRAVEGSFDAAAPEIEIEGAEGVVALAPRGTLRFRPAQSSAPRDPARPAPVPVDLDFEGTLRFGLEKRRLRVAGKVHAQSAGEFPWTLDAREFESQVEGGTGSFTAKGDARFVVRDRLEARGEELRFDPASGEVAAEGDPAWIQIEGGQSLRVQRVKFNLRTGLFSGERGALTDRGDR